MKQDLKRWLILPDCHTPYHDKRALEDLIIGKILPAFDWYGIAILGDFFDNYSVSQHSKDPRRVKDLRSEMEVGLRLLKHFEDYPFKRRIFTEGNHETRLKRALQDRFPEVYEFVVQAWDQHFTRWEYIPYMRDTLIGRVHVTHDVGHSGKNSTRQTLDAYQDNCIIGHNHNMALLVQGNVKGVPHVGASFGWLGDADQIDYIHRMKAKTQWVTGFGYAYERDNGFLYVVPAPIVEGSAVVEGRLFEA